MLLRGRLVWRRRERGVGRFGRGEREEMGVVGLGGKLSEREIEKGVSLAGSSIE